MKKIIILTWKKNGIYLKVFCENHFKQIHANQYVYDKNFVYLKKVCLLWLHTVYMKIGVVYLKSRYEVNDSKFQGNKSVLVL